MDVLLRIFAHQGADFLRFCVEFVDCFHRRCRGWHVVSKIGVHSAFVHKARITSNMLALTSSSVLWHHRPALCRPTRRKVLLHERYEGLELGPLELSLEEVLLHEYTLDPAHLQQSRGRPFGLR